MSQTLNINYQNLTDLLSEAKTEEVLDALEKALSDQPNHTDYLKEVILLSNNHSQLQRARRIDIIGFQNYTTKSNQINNALLEIITDLKEGKAYSSHKTETISLVGFRKIATLLSFLLVAIFAAIGVAAYYFLIDKKEKKIQWECPTYSSLPFKVLVLPFHKELPAGRIPPHQHLVSRLENFSKEESLALQIGTIQPEGVIQAVYTQEEANQYGSKCQPDMLVWGRADILDEKTGLVVHYLLTNPTNFQWLSDFDIEGKTSILLKDALTPTSFKGATQQIEEALEKILRATVAFKSKEYGKVTAIYDSISEEVTNLTTKETDRNLQYMNAESLWKSNQQEKAIATYTNILKEEPNATLALNNRAHLQLEQKEWGKALADFNALETLDKATYETYYKKAEIHEQLGNLGAAEKDYKKAEAASPTQMKATIKDQLQRVEKKIVVKKDKISKSKKPKPNRPNNSASTPRPASPQITKEAVVKNLLKEAVDNNAIGATMEAEKNVMEVLKNHPKNKKALKELIRAKYFQDNTISISDLKKHPYLKNVDSLSLKKLKDPVLDAIIRNERFTNKQLK